MRAVVLHSYGGPEVLTIEEVADPVPGPDEVLVRVAATALNRADLLQRMGLYPDPRRAHPEIPGLEFAGTVASVGARVTMWREGDRVMGIDAGGAYAELIATHERQLLAVPEALDLVDAAAIPEVFLTAWDALVVQGGLTSGRWALVHAGASGVGTAAIQIAKAVGARIAVTCSAGKAELCRSLGADLVFDRSPNDWLAEARAAVPAGFDTILDVVGGEEIDRNLQAVAQRGSIVQVGLMGGGSVQVNVGLLMGKRAHWIGTTLRARPIEEKVAVTRRFAAEMLPMFGVLAGAEAPRLRPVIDRRVAFADIADAHELMETNANAGKIVVVLQP
jgi:putative PIG3 family NAD(P)H quinone oxidoreductase